MKKSIYVITHKPFNAPSLADYVPIEVGASLRKSDMSYLKDNTGDHISYKNKNYCELTGLYWIWKNDCISDIVGITHYRRFFSKFLFDMSEKYFLTSDIIEKDLEQYDLILPIPFYWLKHTVSTGYYEAGQGKEKDLATTGEVIKELFPEYLETYLEVLEAKKASYCNMMICKKTQLNNYCKWLFDILFEVEQRTDLSDYTESEARIYGYLSEILLNVWVKKNNYKVKYYNVAVNKKLTKKGKLFAFIEKVPVLRVLSKISLCVDL